MPRAAWLADCSSSIAEEMTSPNEIPVTPCSTINEITRSKEPSLGIYTRETKAVTTMTRMKESNIQFGHCVAKMSRMCCIQQYIVKDIMYLFLKCDSDWSRDLDVLAWHNPIILFYTSVKSFYWMLKQHIAVKAVSIQMQRPQIIYSSVAKAIRLFSRWLSTND